MTRQDDPRTPTVDGVLQQSIHDIDIPPRPTVIDRIHAEMSSDAPNLRGIAGLISRDVSLAAGLIKTANSPCFGFGRRARSVHEALTMLGLDVSCRAIAAISLRRAFPDSARYERFWHASASVATLSGWLAQQLRVPGVRADDAYTFGLFRDCGIVILLRRFPDYQTVLARANSDREAPFTAIEQAALPTDHTVIGSLLAQNWWLPGEICMAIRHHHSLPALEAEVSPLRCPGRHLVAIAQTAEYLVQALTGGRSALALREVFLEGGDHRVFLALVDLAGVRLHVLVGGRFGVVVAGDMDVSAGRRLVHLEQRVRIHHRQGRAEAADLDVVQLAGRIERVVVGALERAVGVAVGVDRDAGGLIDVAIGLGHVPDGEVVVLEYLGDPVAQVCSPLCRWTTTPRTSACCRRAACCAP
jgi:HD-like signal output (HDOD) protein